ncbi:MAG: reverse transcriptase domain-containing protein, partial [Janthinobacterium lividum]
SFYQSGEKIAMAISEKNSNLYNLIAKVQVPDKVLLTTKSLQEWHEALGHQNKRHVKNFLEDRGVTVKPEAVFCESCVLGKHCRMTFGERVEKSKQPGELIFADVCGPMQVDDICGNKYFLVFKDDFSSYRKVYLIKTKDEVKSLLPNFVELVKVQTDVKILELRTDNGREFDNEVVKNYVESIGLKHSKTAPYSPQQNGVAERENRILCEMARCWLHAVDDLPQSLWGEAVLAAAYTLNMSGPTKVKGKSPYELFTKKNSRWESLRVFGAECYAWIPQKKRRKWDQKSQKGFFVGYSDCGYRIYFKDKRTVVVCRDVIFMQHEKNKTMESVYIYEDDSCDKDVSVRDNAGNGVTVEIVEENGVVADTQGNGQERNDDSEDNFEECEPVVEVRQMNLRDRSNIRRPERYTAMLIHEAPDTYDEAINSDDSAEWKVAMKEEIDSLMENKTWVLVDKPQNKKVIDNKWIFTKKLNSKNEVSRFKARLVARGFTQIPGIDYIDTFSPVTRLETVRALLGVAVQRGWNIKQFDVKTAFLYGALEEDLYMKQPRGFEDGTGRVCKLIRSLYGLKQSPKCWYKCLVEFLKEKHFKESSADPCMFYQEDIIVLFHVDDGLVIGKDLSISNFIQDLSGRFKIRITDGECYLGLHIESSENKIFVHQSGYVERLLTRYDVNQSKPLSLPIEPGWSTGNSKLLEGEEKKNYREMVGALLYVALATRPDLAFAVNVACRGQDQATLAHLNLVKRIFSLSDVHKERGYYIPERRS